MTKGEWINRDLEFYHITPTTNLERIFLHGLRKGNDRGICVVRSNDELIIRYICETMLNVDENLDFSIIRILPSSIHLLATEITNDYVDEYTNPLHNYISRNVINITSADVIGTYQARALGIENVSDFETEISRRFVLRQLD